MPLDASTQVNTMLRERPKRSRRVQLYKPDADLLRWFRLHFPASAFHGRLVLGMRSDAGMQTLFTGEKEAVHTLLEQFYGSPRRDYYITANEISGVSRCREGLFALDNLTVDLDLHGEGVDYQSGQLNELADRLLWYLRRDGEDHGLALPHSLVLTGRGMQLWWHIRPCAAACRPYYSEVADHYVTQLEAILQEDSSLQALTVDGGSSRNLVGYFRLPCTYNTAAGVFGTVRFPAQEPEYVLQELWKLVQAQKERQREELRPEPPRKPERSFAGDYTSAEIAFLKDIRVTAFFRLRQLTDLRILRNREVGEETRNNLCFLVYNSLLTALGHEKAWERLLLFNQGFKLPMTEKELQNTIVSCQRKGGYRYRNASIISLLEITEEEQRAIGLYEPTQEYSPYTRSAKNPSRDAERAMRRENQAEQIRRLSAAGKTAREIAETLGISRHSAQDKLRDCGGNAAAQRRSRVQALLEQGLTPKEIAQREGCCLKTVQNIMKRQEIEKS